MRASIVKWFFALIRFVFPDSNLTRERKYTYSNGILLDRGPRWQDT
jgi:hypothetical protein